MTRSCSSFADVPIGPGISDRPHRRVQDRAPVRALHGVDFPRRHGEEIGRLDALSSGVDEVHGVLEIGVGVADPHVQESLDDRDGPGVVKLRGALEPVDSGDEADG